jgi:hypothetical protein
MDMADSQAKAENDIIRQHIRYHTASWIFVIPEEIEKVYKNINK